MRVVPPFFWDWWSNLFPSFLLGLTVQQPPQIRSSIFDASIASSSQSSQPLIGTRWTLRPNIYWIQTSLSSELLQPPFFHPRNGQTVPLFSAFLALLSFSLIFSWLPRLLDTFLFFRKSFDERKESTFINCISYMASSIFLSSIAGRDTALLRLFSLPCILYFLITTIILNYVQIIHINTYNNWINKLQ